MATAGINRTLIFIAIYVLSGTVVSAQDGFFFTIPKVLREGDASQFCLTAYSSSGHPRNVTMSLVNTENAKIKVIIEDLYENGVETCQNFTVPQANDYLLLLYNETDILHDSVEIAVQPHSQITLVQTDKPMYKPGQTVKFRILTMLSTLKPRIGTIAAVYVKEPYGSRVKQFLNIDSKGIASLEFQLSKEAKLGRWQIAVFLNETGENVPEDEMVSFEVKEYVLPRFEVTITPPSYILATDETVQGEVCAKYTYGKDVQGVLDLKVCGSQMYGAGPGEGACDHQVVKLTGCHNFTANATLLLSETMQYMLYGWRLNIDASVTEQGTGSVVNATHKGPSLTKQQLNLELIDTTNGFFKPGLPFHGQVVVTTPDGQPAKGERIRVTAFDYDTNIELAANYTSDENGIVDYSLCGDLEEEVTILSLRAEAVDYLDLDTTAGTTMNTPRATNEIKQWFSPSFSYIQIPRTENKQKCGHNLTLDIPFTTKTGAHITFKYQVVARGKVVASGSHHVHGAEASSQTVTPSSTDTCLVLQDLPDLDDGEETEINPFMSPPMPPQSPPDIDDDDFPPPPPLDRMDPFVPIEEPPLKEPIIRSEFIADTVSSLMLEIPIVTLMSPKFTLVIHHILPDGEIVADSMEFDVEPCFDNNVNMTFDQKTVLPGENVNLRVEAVPGSVCGLGIVDKSVNILGGSHQITMETIFERIERLSIRRWSHDSYQMEKEYCEQRLQGLGDEHYWSITSRYVDATQAFKHSGLRVLTDLTLDTRPCQASSPVLYGVWGPPNMRTGNNGIPGPGIPLPVAVPLSTNSPAPKSVPVRSHFPETWLWDLQVVGENGTLVLPQEAPHTITSWVGNAMCMDGDAGVGISALQELTTFQPFFIHVNLPYAAVREERLPVMISIHNYLDKCLHMKLSFDMGESFEVHNSHRYREPFCVCPEESFTARFYATPTDIGSLPVTAKAEIVPGTCNSNNSVDVDLTYVGLTDAVRRNVLVKAEGVLQEYTHSLYMCANDTDRDLNDVILPLPEGIVKDSERGDITVIGDIMGPALTNLDHLVRLPTGCGEQNMVGFTPNIFVLKYLSNTGLLTEKIHDDAVKYMEIGYQRELNYRHKDGSYSAFGENDKRGSVWLTAFVLKSFAQATPYIYIDPVDIQRSVTFLKRSQSENGCFVETGKVLSSYMMGGLGKKKSDAALTSYVLIALLQAGVNSNETVIVEGFKCIDHILRYTEGKLDVYSLAVSAYASTLLEPFSKSSIEIMKLLETKSKRDGSLKYWNRDAVIPPPSQSLYFPAAASAEVEMTSYALLAYLLYYGEGAVTHSHEIAMWLSHQRNPHGGFASTQDTVVGLNALSEFALMAYDSNPTNVNITVTGQGVDKTFRVSQDDNTKLLVQTTPLKVLPVRLRVSAEGKGCALVQANVRFNKMPQNIGSNKPGFHLKIMTRRYRHDIDRCDRRTINIAVGSRSNQKHSKSMSLVIVKMVTSWTPIKESLLGLKSQFPVIGIKRFEYDEIENTVTFYFDEFKRRPREFTLDVEQDRQMAVTNPKAAQVSVINYYETDIAVVKSYALKTICGTKAEIPRRRVILTPIDNVPIPVQQARVDMSQRRIRPVFQPPGPVASCTGPNCQKCPVCRKSKLVPPPEFKRVVCNAAAVYKTISGRKGSFVLKVRQDLRPLKRVTINSFANYTLPGDCECSLLEPPTNRVFILTSSKLNGKTLELDSQSVIAYASRRIERELLKFMKTCPSN